MIHGWMEWLALWHNTHSRFRELSEVLDGVAMPEAPFPPCLECSAGTHGLPLILQHFLVVFTTRVLHAREAQDPRRHHYPAHGTESHRALAVHETPEPEPRFDEAEEKEAWDDGCNNDDPHCQTRAAAVIRVAVVIVVVASSTAQIAGARRICIAGTGAGEVARQRAARGDVDAVIGIG